MFCQHCSNDTVVIISCCTCKKRTNARREECVFRMFFCRNVRSIDSQLRPKVNQGGYIISFVKWWIVLRDVLQYRVKHRSFFDVTWKVLDKGHFSYQWSHVSKRNWCRNTSAATTEAFMLSTSQDSKMSITWCVRLSIWRNHQAEHWFSEQRSRCHAHACAHTLKT